MGRVRTHMAVVSAGWGPSGRRFKSGLPDSLEAGAESWAPSADAAIRRLGGEGRSLDNPRVVAETNRAPAMEKGPGNRGLAIAFGRFGLGRTLTAFIANSHRQERLHAKWLVPLMRPVGLQNSDEIPTRESPARHSGAMQEKSV